jgi:TrmH family RNA methyltransferase
MPSRSERKLWRSLRRRKGREASGLFLAEGPRLLAELLAGAVVVERVLVAPEAYDAGEIRASIEAARARGWSIEEVELDEVRELADTVTPQPVLAIARIPPWGWQDIGVSSVLVLDGIQDPGNVGTLLRTGAALGIGGALCLPGTVDPWSPKAARASAGAGLHVPVLRTSWDETREQLRTRELPLWAADPEGEPLSREDPVPAAVALALGSESHGLSTDAGAAADRRISIGMPGPVESLNVAAAGAILLDRLVSRTAPPHDRMDRRGVEDAKQGGA